MCYTWVRQKILHNVVWGGGWSKTSRGVKAWDKANNSVETKTRLKNSFPEYGEKGGRRGGVTADTESQFLGEPISPFLARLGGNRPNI